MLLLLPHNKLSLQGIQLKWYFKKHSRWICVVGDIYPERACHAKWAHHPISSTMEMWKNAQTILHCFSFRWARIIIILLSGIYFKIWCIPLLQREFITVLQVFEIIHIQICYFCFWVKCWSGLDGWILELAMWLWIMRVSASISFFDACAYNFPDPHSVFGSIYRSHDRIYADIRKATYMWISAYTMRFF